MTKKLTNSPEHERRKENLDEFLKAGGNPRDIPPYELFDTKNSPKEESLGLDSKPAEADSSSIQDLHKAVIDIVYGDEEVRGEKSASIMQLIAAHDSASNQRHYLDGRDAGYLTALDKVEGLLDDVPIPPVFSEWRNLRTEIAKLRKGL